MPDPDADDRPPLDLSPAEWSLATWRPAPEPPSGEPPPFDERVAREALRLARGGWVGWAWTRTPIRVPMSREEAWYWLRLTTPLQLSEAPARRHAAVMAEPREITPQKAIVLASISGLPEGDAMAPLVTLIGAEAALEVVLGALPPLPAPWDVKRVRRHPLATGVRAHLWPYLDDAERERLMTSASEGIRKAMRDPSYQAGDAALLAAQAGLHDEVQELCARWEDDCFAGSTWTSGQPDIAFGAGSGEALEAIVERTKLHFSNEREVAGWLAHTELRRLDWIVASAKAQSSREGALIVAGALAARVHAAEAVPAMLELQTRSKAAAVARAWLPDHPEQAARGLLGLLDEPGQLADAAREELERMART